MTKVLVVSENPATRREVTETMERRQEFQVTAVEDFDTAYRKLQTEAFAVLITGRKLGTEEDEGIKLAESGNRIQPAMFIILFTDNFEGLSNNRPKYLHRIVIRPDGLNRLPEVARELLSVRA